MAEIYTRAGSSGGGGTFGVDVVEPQAALGDVIQIQQNQISNFEQASNTVLIDGQAASFTVTSPSRITATVPFSATTGVGKIVQVNSGAFSATTPLTVIFQSPGSVVADAYQVAFNATGQTLSGTQYNAIRDFVDAINGVDGLIWADNVFGFYPHLGLSTASQQINACSPGTGDISISASLNASGAALPLGGALIPPAGFMSANWTASNYRGWLMKVSDHPLGANQFGNPRPIAGLEGLTNGYLFETTSNGVKLVAHTVAPETSGSLLTAPYTGTVGCFSIDSGGGNARDRPFINGTATSAGVSAAKTANTSFRIGSGNGVSSPSFTTNAWLLTKSVAGLTSSQIGVLHNAFTTFLTTIGR